MQKVHQIRCQAVLDHLREQGIAKGLIGKPVNICYLTGIMIHPYERLVAMLFDAESNTWSMILPRLEKGIAETQGIPEIIYSDEQDPFALLADVLGTCESLGLESDYFSLRFGYRLEEKVNISRERWIDFSGFIERQRIIKDEQEIEMLQTAARIGDQVLAEAKDRIRIGMTEKQLQLELFRAMAAHPGVIVDSFVIQILSGELSANPHGASGDRPFQAGDSLTIDYGVCYQHYWSDYTRNFFLGEPDPEWEKIYNIVLEAQLAAIATIRPGIAAREVDLAARNVITRHGYGEQFIHRTGHGIGLNIHEYPKIHSQNDELLQEGMVFTVEPGIYLPHKGGIRIEDDVVVTQQGARILNTYPKSFRDMIL